MTTCRDFFPSFYCFLNLSFTEFVHTQSKFSDCALLFRIANFSIGKFFVHLTGHVANSHWRHFVWALHCISFLLTTAGLKNWRDPFSEHITKKECFLSVIIPLPVPNWASAEAQFIPNFSFHTKLFLSFFCIFVFLPLCSSCCSRLTRERLLPDRLRWKIKAIVIEISNEPSIQTKIHLGQKTSSVPERSNHYIILSIVYFIYYTARRLIDEAENWLVHVMSYWHIGTSAILTERCL